jgi:hypothetical protein
MIYSVIAIPYFRRVLKKLAKKYPSLKADLARLIEDLQQEPKQGTPLGNQFIQPLAEKRNRLFPHS